MSTLVVRSARGDEAPAVYVALVGILCIGPNF